MARRLTRLVKAFSTINVKPIAKELRALKSLAEIINRLKQCPYCGAHREKGWMEKHRQGCPIWKQLSVVIDVEDKENP